MIDAERLANLPLFGELDRHDLGILAARVREVAAEAGALLIEQGQMPTDVYIIESGTVEISRDGAVVGTQGPGDVVGEIALVDPQRRTATVRVLTPVTAIALGVEDFRRITDDMPEIGRELRAIAERRLAELDRP